MSIRRRLLLGMFVVTSGLIWAVAAPAAEFELLRVFENASAEGPELFGGAVALQGDQVAIGAHLYGSGDTVSGRVFLFDGATGELLRTFDDPTPTHIDRFGRSVALEGNRLLVGAPGDDSVGEPIFHPGLEALTGIGQVHLFDVESGDLIATWDDPSPSENDYFGSTVRLQGDRALVTAPSDDSIVPESGQVHLYDVETGRLLQTLNDPSAQSVDYFGTNAAFHGNYALATAGGAEDLVSEVHVLPGEEPRTYRGVGETMLFDLTTGEALWTNNDLRYEFLLSLGSLVNAVDLDENRMLLGMNGAGINRGAAYLFDLATKDLLATYDNPAPDSSFAFAGQVVLAGDYVVIGDPDYQQSPSLRDVGRVYVFDAVTAELLQTIENPAPRDGLRFGRSIAVDGDQLLIGAPLYTSEIPAPGRAYLFALVPEPPTGWLLALAAMGAALRQVRD